jgi:hypothetical protein
MPSRGNIITSEVNVSALLNVCFKVEAFVLMLCHSDTSCKTELLLREQIR